MLHWATFKTSVSLHFCLPGLSHFSGPAPAQAPTFSVIIPAVTTMQQTCSKALHPHGATFPRPLGATISTYWVPAAFLQQVTCWNLSCLGNNFLCDSWCEELSLSTLLGNWGSLVAGESQTSSFSWTLLLLPFFRSVSKSSHVRTRLLLPLHVACWKLPTRPQRLKYNLRG
jgi:hypothetical protein